MRLTTEHTARARGLSRSPARGVLAASAVAVLALGLAGPGLAGSATASAEGSSRGSVEGAGTAVDRAGRLESLGRGSSAAALETGESGEARPVAVAVVRKADGSLKVETYETGTVAAAGRVAGELEKRDDVVAAEVDHTVTALVTPSNDPFYTCQWALASSVPASGKPCAGAAVAPNSLKASTSVWDKSDGEGVTVAVVDSGVKADHVDLQGQVLDGVDLIGSSSNKGKKDFYGHGTHVAGIIAAADNSEGIVGLAPKVKILPVRVLDASGNGSGAGVAEGIFWAVDQGADVINLSVGGAQSSEIQAEAVRYALARGVLLVASAGNSSEDGNPTMYPAAIPGVLAVAATQSDGTRAGFSERKAYNAVAAPGVGILSTYIDGEFYYDKVTKQWYEFCPESDGFNGDDCVIFMGGTSMAAPYVSAAAALLLAKQPELSPAALSAYITGTATDVGTTGRDTWYGFGHLNAGKALAQLDAGTARPTSVGLAPSSTRIKAGTTISLKATVASNGYRLPYRKVAFQRLNLDGSWTTLGTVNTNTSGNASLSVKPSRHTKYRAVAGAVTGLEAGKSSTQTVAMYAKITRSGSSPSADRVTVKAQAYPKAKVTLKLQRKVSGTWKTISTKTTSSTGAVTFSKVKAPTGKRYFRVIGGKSSLAGDGKSSTLTLRVK